MCAPLSEPRIGVGLASHDQPLTERETSLLRQLKLDHLRVDLHLESDQYAALLRRAAAEAAALGMRLEVAVFVSDPPERQLKELLEHPDSH